jgi:hypothetical protein
VSDRRISLLPREAAVSADEQTRPGTMRSMTLEIARMNDTIQGVAESQLELKSNVDAVLAKLEIVEDEIKKRPQISRRAVWLIAIAAVAVAVRLWTSPAPGDAPSPRTKYEQQQHSQQHQLRSRHLAPVPVIRRKALIASEVGHNRGGCSGSENAVKRAAGPGRA